MSKYTNFTVLFLFLTFLAACNTKPRHKQTHNNNPALAVGVTTTVIPTNPTKPIIKVYFENSGSMDGYVKGHTDFEYSLYKLLTDIGDTYSETNLNVVFSSGTRSLGKDANIINNFEPGTGKSLFRQSSDKVTGSQLENIIRNTVKNTGQNIISILVSDFIYSNNASNPQIAGVAIQKIFQDKIRVTKDFALFMIKLDSQFDGIYSPEYGGIIPYSIKQRRPYYIWIFGESSQIAAIKKTIDGANLKGYSPNNFYMISKSVNSFEYQVLFSPRIGRYQIDKNQPKTSIQGAEIETKGANTNKFQFSVGIDFSKYALPESYLMDKSNYITNSNYTIEIIKNPTAAGSKYTHILKLTTSQIKNEPVQIELKNNLPKWIEAANSENDSNVKITDQQNKTFGYKYLAKGIYDAYAMSSIFKITISIKK